jgi:hypothetical protein
MNNIILVMVIFLVLIVEIYDISVIRNIKIKKKIIKARCKILNTIINI